MFEADEAVCASQVCVLSYSCTLWKKKLAISRKPIYIKESNNMIIKSFDSFAAKFWPCCELGFKPFFFVCVCGVWDSEKRRRNGTVLSYRMYHQQGQCSEYLLWTHISTVGKSINYSISEIKAFWWPAQWSHACNLVEELLELANPILSASHFKFRVSLRLTHYMYRCYTTVHCMSVNNMD